MANFPLASKYAVGEYTRVTLLISPAALKALGGMPKKDREAMLARLKKIAAAPNARHGASVNALKGAPAGRFRVRHGDWRAVYVISGDDAEVVTVGHRREVYD